MAGREVHVLQTKKNSRQNSLNSGNMTNASNGQGTSRAIPDQEEVKVSFYNEISNIMRGFGDCDHPLEESVQLVEKILQQQLRGILNDAMAVAARRRGKPIPGQADFEFLMRKHPVKINRMRKHVKDQKLLRRILNMQAGRTEDTEGNQDPDEETETEIAEKFDEEKTRRLFRADRISQLLTGTQYFEFNEARRTSFYCRHSERMKLKFKNCLGIPADVQLPNYCMSILAYLAHETIAAIVDFAILTRLNSANRQTDPYSRVTPSGTSYNMLHICPEVSQGRGMDGVKPITVQEILEAVRRQTQITRRGMGFHRNNIDSDMRTSYLAL